MLHYYNLNNMAEGLLSAQHKIMHVDLKFTKQTYLLHNFGALYTINVAV